jgi:hypothetical protein
MPLRDMNIVLDGLWLLMMKISAYIHKSVPLKLFSLLVQHLSPSNLRTI